MKANSQHKAAALRGAMAFFTITAVAATLAFIGNKSGLIQNPWFQFALLFGWAGGGFALMAPAINQLEKVKASSPKCPQCDKPLLGLLGRFALASEKCQACSYKIEWETAEQNSGGDS